MKKIRVGIAGLGNVGRGVYEILQKDAALLSLRSNAKFEITAVSSRGKKDFIADGIKFYQDALQLALDAEIDVIVEVIGGTEIAKNLIETALKNGKKIVTANKALLAEFGFELVQLAEKNNSLIAFEAGVGGAIPIIKNFREGLAANEIKEFYAILNGTSNFILTKMQSENLDFSAALKQAQKLGYAEADPAFDINGTDTAHKLTLLTAIASSTKPALSKISVEGIEKITISDIKLAQNLDYKIKLLAVYKNSANAIEAAVYPALLASSEKISQIDDSFNAILTKASNADWNLCAGRGAGTLPTASAIVADLVDMARGFDLPMFGIDSTKLSEAKISDISNRVGKYFISFTSAKKLVLDDLVKIFAKDFLSEIAVEKHSSFEHNGKNFYGVITQNIKESKLCESLRNKASNLIDAIKFIRIEETNF